MNTSIEPATMPGSVSGMITRKNALNSFAYRSWAASTSEKSSRSIDA